MEKRIKLGLSALILAGLTACGGSQESGREKIVIWEQMEPAGRAAFMEIIEDFHEINSDIEIVVTHYQNEDLRTQFQNSALAGQGPDMVYGPNDNVGIFTISDLIKPVEEVVSEDFINRLDKDAYMAGSIKGVGYAIPDMNGNQIALLYNKAMVEKAPKTWDEFLEVATEYQKLDESTYGFLYNEKEPYWFVGWYNGFGGRVMNENYEPTLDNEAMVKALQFTYDIKHKYKLGAAGMDYDLSSEIFKQGKAAFLLNGAWSWKEYEDAGIDLGIAVMPKLPGGDSPLFYSSTKGFSISQTVSEEKYDEINQILEFIFAPENNAKYTISQSQAPAVTKTRSLYTVRENELMQASISTIEKTTPMPIVTEMRAIWDAMRPNLEAVINGTMTPEAAATKMQKDAVEGIRTLKGE